MIKLRAKAYVGFLATAFATAGFLTAGAGTATAATLQNTLQGTYYGTQWLTPHQQCINEENARNKQTYGSEDGGDNQYFYCALGDRNIAYNLWWRHYV
ncbi:hypothetical protein AB0J81_31780 [Streptomyces bobili]|uniref:hypothetical protein n=1 Tax=Streptomyces bobili TaxID=67280 RepID=UPI003412B68F